MGNSSSPWLSPTPFAGHPHRRGELSPIIFSAPSAPGPSPQAWGTRSAPDSCRAGLRAIPTGVGNSPYRTPRREDPPGHPHRRGELRRLTFNTVTEHGPSPQAWGTRCCSSRCRRGHRAIPTGVGNSYASHRTGSWNSGHPHRRGELTATATRCNTSRGPSPQAWGTHEPFTPAYTASRAIPTGVGNSAGSRARSGASAGHPHRRGELRLNSNNATRYPGPSPQAWGTHLGREGVVVRFRAIPTGVGNSAVDSPAVEAGAGHPHRRGELLFSSVTMYPAAGPSPQAWGTPKRRQVLSVPPRAIPTGVGNSHPTPPGSTGWAGHPHRRGELLACGHAGHEGAGPSPQAWGTLVELGGVRAVHRAIPTGVGNSPGGWRSSRAGTGHPHRRGELTVARFIEKSPHGPSPQAWGTQHRPGGSLVGRRAIPTGVGNSSVPAQRRARRSGHPHRRGELGGCASEAEAGDGPSPQAWGTP